MDRSKGITNQFELSQGLMKEFSYPELLDELQSLNHHKNIITCQKYLKYTDKLHFTYSAPMVIYVQVRQNNTTISGIRRGLKMVIFIFVLINISLNL